ncbi:MAG: NADH-quinone oxidoreductase subunit J [Burkholderiaceae bacterium]|nr:NADH-quinone oxidoreductase subunit J [Burkholderiaceae bacterium]
MDVKTAFFYVFSLVMLFAAFRVITARNPVHAVLYLMLTFSQAAGIWLLLKAEFLAITLVLVYLGAVMVLFLFVVMMLDINIDSLRQGFWRHFPLALGIGAVISLEMAMLLFRGFNLGYAPVVPDTVTNAAGQVVQYSNTKALGELLYTQYLYPVEIAAVILLVAMVTAIALTLRERKDSKKIDPSEQVRVRARDRFELIKLAPTQAPPRAEAAAQAPAEEVKK